jgi:hypothetical protein
VGWGIEKERSKQSESITLTEMDLPQPSIKVSIIVVNNFSLSIVDTSEQMASVVAFVSYRK